MLSDQDFKVIIKWISIKNSLIVSVLQCSCNISRVIKLSLQIQESKRMKKSNQDFTLDNLRPVLKIK